MSAQFTSYRLTSLCILLFSGLCGQAETLRIQQRQTVDQVWAGHPVGFALLTDADRERQYVGYYDVERNLVIASRSLDSEKWAKQVLPTNVGWDSHNSIVLALDREGQLHVSGNMHASPMIYFRTTKPGDVTTLTRIPNMVGLDREQRVTYPRFISLKDDTLIFTYRDGKSGSGDQIFIHYDEASMKWHPLLDTSLFSGVRPANIPRPLHDQDDMMNAYPVGPTLGLDGFWHMTWVWRDTYRAETNHDLSYARSRDLIHWETVDGKAITLPISLDTPGLIIDPIPAMGGIINGSGQFGFDDQNRIIVSYHKFDEKGATQIYLARAENGQWKIRRLTNWTYRWYPEGGGSLPTGDVAASAVKYDPSVGLYLSLRNTHHSGGLFRIDSNTLALGDKIPNEDIPSRLPVELSRGVRSELQRRSTADIGTSPTGLRYLLQWQTQPANRDRDPGTPIPEPSDLELITLEVNP